MFILTTISDLVQVPPHEFYKRSRDEIEDKINEKYANKVVHKVGLCICMYDLLKASDGLIGHGTGNVNVNVEFRMIVFRPFKGEIIAAVVKRSIPSGIQVSTQFFEDIFVPSTMLFEGSQFDEDEKTWVWKSEEADVWFDPGTIVNIRIEQEHWQDRAPRARVANGDSNLEPQPHVPYSLTASIAEGGLGGIDWW